MTRIHVDLLELHRQLTVLKTVAWHMNEDVEQVRRALKRLALVWDGPAALDFLQDAWVLQRRLEEALLELEVLLRRLAREMQHWEELDRAWALFWSQRFPSLRPSWFSEVAQEEP